MIPGWLLHGDLPPVGDRVVLAGGTGTAPVAIEGFAPFWVQSGTAALALALLTARARRPDVADPAVVLPAYGCPDLVTAADFAGLRPLLVDIGADDPGYCLDALASALDRNIVAVVAVNFLGVRERLADIRQLLVGRADALLIEDNAQWFPEPLPQPELEGDLVCTSFGRGKPASLLGGGVLFARAGLAQLVPAQRIAAPLPQGRSAALKRVVYNRLLARHCYWLVNRNPLIELGATRYKPLPAIHALDAARLEALSAVVARYQASPRTTEQRWLEALARLPGIAMPARERAGRLLRLPVLCDSAERRDRLWRALDRAGLGASAMYRQPLPSIEGVAGRNLATMPIPCAEAFAARLLTLPLHAQVGVADIERACRVITAV